MSCGAADWAGAAFTQRVVPDLARHLYEWAINPLSHPRFRPDGDVPCPGQSLCVKVIDVSPVYVYLNWVHPGRFFGSQPPGLCCPLGCLAKARGVSVSAHLGSARAVPAKIEPVTFDAVRPVSPRAIPRSCVTSRHHPHSEQLTCCPWDTVLLACQKSSETSAATSIPVGKPPQGHSQTPLIAFTSSSRRDLVQSLRQHASITRPFMSHFMIPPRANESEAPTYLAGERNDTTEAQFQARQVNRTYTRGREK